MVQRRQSSLERLGGGDVESFGDPSQSGDRLPLIFGCAFLPWCRVLDDLLENVRVAQCDVLNSGLQSSSFLSWFARRCQLV